MRKIYTHLLTIVMMFFGCISYAVAQTTGPIGFVNYNDMGLAGVTGGGNGEIVMVAERAAFDAAVAGDTPRTVILTKTIEGDGMEDCNDEVQIGSNKTIMALSPEVEIKGINLVASGKHNIIIRNITLTKGKPDGLTFHNCHHVWIDHCDLSACDDGLLDFTLGSSYMTVSYCKIHDHNKVSLCNSGTQHYEDVGRQRVTYHHNYWYGGVQRNPRIGYGLGHVFNNYYENISSYCIGYHSSAKVLSENNHFSATAKNPLNSMYSSDPNWVTYAEARDRGSYVANGSIGTQQGTVFEPADYYDYAFALEEARGLDATIKQEAGPKEGLCDEPILYPGNGATDVTSDVKPMCSGMTNCELRITQNADGSGYTAWDASYKLSPATTYYWYATGDANGKTVKSAVYQFRTAATTASNPYPKNGETQANLREAVAEKQFNGNMKLRWRHAFDAKKYKVAIKAAGEEEKTFVTTENVLDPGYLRHNTQYEWSVTPLDADGNVIAPATEPWTFSSSIATIKTGTTNAELMTRNQRAFIQAAGATDADGRTVNNFVVPDAGPGCVMATFNGDDDTRVQFTVCFRDRDASGTPSKSGKSFFALYVNDQQVEWWQAHQATSGFYSRVLGKHVTLNKGDEIRVEFYTTVQSANWTQLAWIKLKRSSDDDEEPETQMGKSADESYTDPFAESWWPNATTFHSPQPESGKDYEIVYFPAYETSTQGIYALKDASQMAWVDGRYHQSERTIYNPVKDDLRSTMTQKGIVCGEYGIMADGISYPCVFSLSIENTSHVRCYIAGSASYKNRMKVTVIPVGDEGGQFDVYSANGVGKNVPDYLDIYLDPKNQYRLLFNGEKEYAMFLGAVRLYTADAASGISAPTVSSASSIRYNLSGQRVSDEYKGITLEKGKKSITTHQ